MRTTAMLTGGLFLAGALALAATHASAQGQAKSDGGRKGATSGPPQSQSRSKPVPSPLLPEKREVAPDAAEVPEGGDDEAARAPHTCPDRGNKLELII